MNRKKRSALIAMITAFVAAFFAVVEIPGSSNEDWSPKQDNAWVTFDSAVYKLLPDDNKGSRHQRFLVRTPGGQSLLIAHNIDLADRVPIREGSQLEIRGQFEWNEKGGVVHWTHHDPQGRRDGGYIKVGGKTIR